MSASYNEKSEGGVAETQDARLAPDEVSISDLVRDIGRQWKVVVAVPLLFLVIASFYTYLSTDLYRYNVEIEIGQSPNRELPETINFVVLPESGGRWLNWRGFETPNIVMNQLENALVPEAIRSVSEEIGRDMEVSISNPDDPHGGDTRIVRLSAVAPKKHENEINRILQLAAAKVVLRHTDYLRGIRQQKESEISRFEDTNEELARRVNELNSRINRLQQLVDRSGERALGAAIELNVLLPERKNVVSERTGTAHEINKLEQELEALDMAITEMDTDKVNEEVLQRQSRVTAVLKAGLSVQPTRSLNLASRESRPVGVDPELILGLALVLGVGIGLILALIVQAVVRERTFKGD